MAPKRLANITKVKKTLVLLANSKPSVVKKILSNANKHIIKAISEICLNMLNGCVHLSTSQKSKLKPFKKTMRDLSAPSTNLLAKRKIVQRGGFISTLLGVGLPLLIKGITSLVGVIRKKKRQRKGSKR